MIEFCRNSLFEYLNIQVHVNMKSLERMVIDFAKERNCTSEELESISNRVKDGDISIVLKLYEQELKVKYCKLKS